ncbi:hypothetical protein SteCoe_8722 [Stentor coeruleus]|uniref:non-specific serine/threonine protein kinase n=1 Tax=Stentor coeruleus TaxID=5963 RepID=A0A1R2CJF6_9CILI|nr:hypothetical protein SteCoe_8722 [Stentor coeruleus]
MEKISEQDLNLSNAYVLYQNADRVTVFLTELRDKGRIVVKKLMISSLEEGNFLLKETFAMAHLNHPNIAKLHSSMMGGKNNAFQYILFVMDYFEDGDLQKEIESRWKQNNPWTEDELLEIFKSLLSGFAYMQLKQIAHCDIKPQNVLRRGKSYIISDLGCAFKTEGDSFNIAGTPAYLSPALRLAYQSYKNTGIAAPLKHNAYKSDVYSLGLVFLYMTSFKLYQELETLDENQHYESLTYIYHTLQYGDVIKNLIFWMMRFDEQSRPDFSEIAQVLQIEVQKRVTQSIPRKRPSSCQVMIPPELKNIKNKVNSSIKEEKKDNNLSCAQRASERQIRAQGPNRKYLVAGTNINSGEIINPMQIKMQPQFPTGNQKNNFRHNQMIACTPAANVFNCNNVPANAFNCNNTPSNVDYLLLVDYTAKGQFSLICRNAHRKMFKWRVSINLFNAKTIIVNRLSQAIFNLDPSCLNILALKNSLCLKVIINKISIKCKICYQNVNDNFIKYPCGGFIHKACFQQNFAYAIDRENNNFSLQSLCKFCNTYHILYLKKINLCACCQNVWTFYKDSFQGFYCFPCINQSQETNEHISIFKIIARDTQEYLFVSDKLCYYCFGLVELIMSNSYYVCLACRFLLANKAYEEEKIKVRHFQMYNSVIPEKNNHETNRKYASDDTNSGRTKISQMRYRNSSHAQNRN